MVAATLTLASGSVHAAALGPLEADRLLATTTPAELAANPVSYAQHLTSDGPLEYCATVTVTNHSQQAVEWEITLNISAQPYNAASVGSSYGVTTVSFEPSLWRVRGAGYNAVIGAGQSYDWGYCGTRAPSGLVDLTPVATITQDDASQFCVSVLVATASTDWVRWRVTLDHGTAGLTASTYWLAGVPSNYSNATSVSFANGAWVVRGVAFNEYVRAGSPATFTYCAPPAAGADLVDASVAVAITSQDSQQYCGTVTVSTTSTTWVRWRATIDHTTPGVSGQVYWLNAAPTSFSNAQQISFAPATGAWVLQGLPYNQAIRAGSPATWSYCAPTNTDVLTDAPYVVHVTSSGAWGYCADVTVSNPTAAAITWRVRIDHTTPGLTAPSFWLTAQPANLWNATTISFAAATGAWVLRGASFNQVLQPGAMTTFGYCKQ